MKKIEMVLVDDHQMLRAMWMRLFAEDPRLKVVGDSGEFSEAIRMIQMKSPDIVLLDIQLRNASGLDAIPLIKKYSPHSAIIGVSLHSHPMMAKKMIEMGARGYVTKNSSPEDLFRAIDQVMNGEIYVCSEIQSLMSEKPIRRFKQPNGLEKLTDREKQIARMLKKGLSSREISEYLKVSIRTVDAHRYHILKKLEIRNTVQLVNFMNTGN
jgi:DNA-binding NarL/FixJ family response regulator